MKKITPILCVIAVMSLFYACEPQEPVPSPTDPADTTATTSDTSYTSFANAKELVGLWVRVDSGKVGYCSYEIDETRFSYRAKHRGYINENDTFVCTSHTNWDEVSTQSQNYTFDAEKQSINVSLLGSIAVLTRMSKDSTRLVSGMFNWDCLLYRVKGVRVENPE